MKKCTKCGEQKPLEQFYRDKSTKDGRHPWCKSHARKSAEPVLKAAYDREYRKHNWLAKKANQFKIDKNALAAMFADQKDLCAICHLPEADAHPSTGLVQRLAIDHCHRTGKVRGLLCGRCNKAIGLLRDSPTNLLNAIAYLEKAS